MSTKPLEFDLLVIGGGIAAAATALAAALVEGSLHAGPAVARALPGSPARRRLPSSKLLPSKLPGKRPGMSVCLVGADPPADITAASYAFLNPAAADLLPPLKSGGKSALARLGDGSFKGLGVMTAREGRHAEFANRAISGYFIDGPKLLKGLLAACRDAGVKLVRTKEAAPAGAPHRDPRPSRSGPPTQPRFFTDDHSVHAVWPGGHCQGKLALLTDPETVLAGQAEGLGFRHQWMISRSFPCLGQTFAATPARLDAAFGKVRQMVTVWQLPSLEAGGPGRAPELTAPTGHDGHAWLLPKADSVSIGVMAGQPVGGWFPDSRVHHGRSRSHPGGEGAWLSTSPAERMAAVISELRAINVLPREISQPITPVASWHLPVAAALEIESHVGKRALAVGLAGGFVAALSGQWLYPVIQAAVLAATVVSKALADPRPQDVLSEFGARWRHVLSDYLRSPNTRLAFLLPLVFGNRQIADRFSRAYLFGENF